jgi:hypothetical protein
MSDHIHVPRSPIVSLFFLAFVASGCSQFGARFATNAEWHEVVARDARAEGYPVWQTALYWGTVGH